MNACSVVIDDGNLCGESPLWSAAEQKLFWTDCVGRRFYSYDWRTQEREVLLQDFEVNGCSLDRSGSLVFINNSGVWLWDRTERPVCLASESDGQSLALNDAIADPQGRLLAGSSYYHSDEGYPLGKLYCFGPDGAVRILDEGFHLANGLGFSPDHKILYFTDSVARSIYAYDYDVDAGQVRDRRLLVKVDENRGLPDGLTVDADGFVWSAEWYGGCIVRYDPAGKVERRIAVPAKQTSSLAFGGRDLRTIFVTSAARSEPMPVMPPGYDPEHGYFGGALFRIDVEVQGKPDNQTRLKDVIVAKNPDG